MSMRLAIDIGGTFTDLVLDEHGQRHTTKVLTTPERPADALMQGIDRILSQSGVEAGAIGLVVHGTTLATNALIERKGARTALITTKGHRDTLEMAFENRFDQYDIQADRNPPLIRRELRFEVGERTSYRGETLTALDDDSVTALIPALQAARIDSGSEDDDFDRNAFGSSLFLGADTPLGAAYLARGQGDGGRRAAYLYFGRLF